MGGGGQGDEGGVDGGGEWIRERSCYTFIVVKHCRMQGVGDK